MGGKDSTGRYNVQEIGHDIWVLLCRLSTFSGFAADLIRHEYRGRRAGASRSTLAIVTQSPYIYPGVYNPMVF